MLLDREDKESSSVQDSMYLDRMRTKSAKFEAPLTDQSRHSGNIWRTGSGCILLDVTSCRDRQELPEQMTCKISITGTNDMQDFTTADVDDHK